MTNRRIGISLRSLRMPFKQALPTAARLGATAVELDARTIPPREMSQTAIRQVRKLLEDHGLRVAAVSFQTRHGYDVVENLDRRVAATKAAMTFAYAMGTSVVTNFVGRVPDEEDDAWPVLVEALEDLGKHAQQCGAWLCARTGAESGETLARLVKSLGEGSLMVDLDPGALVMNDFSVTDAVAALGPLVQHVHARDAVRDLARGRGLEVPLGRGVVDFPWLMAALEEHRFEGYWTLEPHEATDVVQTLGDAVKYLGSI